MSFLGIFKRIGTVAAEVGGVAAPFINLLPVPGAALASTLLSHVSSAVIQAEREIQGDGTGPLKSAMAKALILEQMGMSVAGDIFAARGETLSYDQTKLQALIDAQVALYNAAAAFKGTIGTTKTIS